MFQKILVPLDGSRMAAAVLPKVAELAIAVNAQVTLVHVCSHHAPVRSGKGSPGRIKAPAAPEAKFCEGFMTAGCKELEDQGLRVDWVCRTGSPALTIITYAQENEYDLIFLGTHGQGAVAWSLGSVAEKVSTHATVPVLLFQTLKMKPPVLKDKMEKLFREAELYIGWALPH
jgi:nucleotide-binding universal stress UspA family protein